MKKAKEMETKMRKAIDYISAFLLRNKQMKASAWLPRKSRFKPPVSF